jgi:hypothetical protein
VLGPGFIFLYFLKGWMTYRPLYFFFKKKPGDHWLFDELSHHRSPKKQGFHFFG